MMTTSERQGGRKTTTRDKNAERQERYVEGKSQTKENEGKKIADRKNRN